MKLGKQRLSSQLLPTHGCPKITFSTSYDSIFQFSAKIVSSRLIFAPFQADFPILGKTRLCPSQLVNSKQIRQGE